MYIVRHIPTGKYIRKLSGSALNIFEYSPDSILTDDIKKARIYTGLNHITNSLGNLKVINEKEETRYNSFTGEKYTITNKEVKYILDTKLFEVIEIDMSIKEK